MNPAAVISFILLAISPWIYLAFAISIGWFFESSLGAWIGCAAIYLPSVILLNCQTAFSARARRTLWGVAATGLLLATAAIFVSHPADC
jgi:chromate transport protein ChrA